MPVVDLSRPASTESAAPLAHLGDPSRRRANYLRPPYDAGRVNRLNQHWLPLEVSGDTAFIESTPVMNARLRDLVRNDKLFRKAAEMHTALAIGMGLASWSEAVIDEKGTYFERFAAENDELHAEWAQGDCDMARRNTHAEQQRLSYHEMITVGMSIWLEVIDRRRTCPICYQLIESEQRQSSSS